MDDDTRRNRGRRMAPRRIGATVVGSLLVVLVAGCSAGSGEPSASGPELAGASMTPSVGASGSDGPGPGSASPSAEPTSTLTPEEQQAFEEATAVVLAYRQTITDLYSGARTDLNDLNDVATGDLLDDNLQAIQKGLDSGRRVDPEGARLQLVDAAPVSFALSDDPGVVVIRGCIDATGIRTVEGDGASVNGVRELLDYHLLKTDYLPAPGWAISSVQGKPNPQDRKC